MHSDGSTFAPRASRACYGLALRPTGIAIGPGYEIGGIGARAEERRYLAKRGQLIRTRVLRRRRRYLREQHECKKHQAIIMSGWIRRVQSFVTLELRLASDEVAALRLSQHERLCLATALKLRRGSPVIGSRDALGNQRATLEL
jgi:hypothetical protein